MRKINEIVVHCTATPEGRAVAVQTIREWHRQRGWSDIGYHFVVHLDGRVEPGRPVAQAGAHVAGRNASTIGVAYVGGVDRNGAPKDTRTAAQKTALRKLLGDLVRQFPAIGRISGHRDYANKACPCFDARAEYDQIAAPKPLRNDPAESFLIKSRAVDLRGSPGGALSRRLQQGERVVATGERSGDWIEVITPRRDLGWIAEAALDQSEEPAPLAPSRTVQGSALALFGTVGTAASEAAAQLEPLTHFAGWVRWPFVALSLIGISWAFYGRLFQARPGRTVAGEGG
jgi:hypothetical protein